MENLDCIKIFELGDDYVAVNGKRVKLTMSQAVILQRLITARGSSLPVNDFISSGDAPNENTLKVQLSKIRTLLQPVVKDQAIILYFKRDDKSSSGYALNAAAFHPSLGFKNYSQPTVLAVGQEILSLDPEKGLGLFLNRLSKQARAVFDCVARGDGEIVPRISLMKYAGPSSETLTTQIYNIRNKFNELVSRDEIITSYTFTIEPQKSGYALNKDVLMNAVRP